MILNEHPRRDRWTRKTRPRRRRRRKIPRSLRTRRSTSSRCWSRQDREERPDLKVSGSILVWPCTEISPDIEISNKEGFFPKMEMTITFCDSVYCCQFATTKAAIRA